MFSRQIRPAVTPRMETQSGAAATPPWSQSWLAVSYVWCTMSVEIDTAHMEVRFGSSAM